MGYHTLLYVVIFLPLCIGAYQLMPAKYRWQVLLGFSYLFFLLLGGKTFLHFIWAAVVTHYIGRWLYSLRAAEKRALEKAHREDRKIIRAWWQRRCRLVLALGVFLLLGTLAYLKYYNFFVVNAAKVMSEMSLPFSLTTKEFLLPIGISFYTLQAIGYMADVYWGKIEAEKSVMKTALFLGFFPQLMEGPICRYTDTGRELFAGKPIQWKNLSDGYVRIFWGLFKKKVVADRLAVAVGTVFGHHTEYRGAVVAAAAVAYTIQLYMEFSGCMDIVIGSGEIFGIRLPENFRQPFKARSAAEFWRRWHITLGAWFKAYIFYPVSMSGLVKRWNQYGRKHAGKYVTHLVTSAIALFPVWLCNGLWHGARWSYLFYGMYYFVLILLGTAVLPVRDKFLQTCHIREESFGWRSIQTAKTWMIIFVGELFFRADGLKVGISMFRSIFQDFHIREFWDGTLLNLGLGRADLIAVILGCIVVAAVGSWKERGVQIRETLARRACPVRWAVYYALILGVVIFAAYGDGYQAVDLIYAGF